MSKRERGNTPDAQETTAALPSGANNTKENKVKKSDKKKSDGSKRKLPNKEFLELLEEAVELEVEVEELKEKVVELTVMLMEQRGVIGYLEHKLEEKNDESA